MDVYICEDDKGKPNFAKVLNSLSLDGTPRDLEEIVDTYSRRLESGVAPKDIFRDTEKSTRNHFFRIIEKIEG